MGLFDLFRRPSIQEGLAQCQADPQGVLVDINQRDEWWISYPVYQAHLMGARALIAGQWGECIIEKLR